MPRLKSADLRQDNRQYIWQVYEKPPLDGLLVSYHPLKNRAPKYLLEKIEKDGIHSALGYGGPIICDCGAFSYVKERNPPYSPDQLLDFYDKCGFDTGATIDHLILGKIKKDDEERNRRFELTLSNAREMYRKWRKNYQDSFDLIGVTQGWDSESYADGVEELIKVGFYRIGIGGLAGASSRTIGFIVDKIHSRIQSLKSNVDLHFFGVNPLRGGRSDVLSAFKNNDVSSFDTAIMLRQAWSRKKDNYLLNGRGYTAVRVRTDVPTELSDEVLEKLRDYADEKRSLHDVLIVLQRVCKEERRKWLSLYRRTLKDRPWERCDCEICKNIGIDVLVFRGNERNMRRGFHNVYQFYDRFIERESPSVLRFQNSDSERL